MGQVGTAKLTEQYSGGIDENGIVTMTEVYKVLFDHWAIPPEACYATGVPQRCTGSGYLRVKDVQARAVAKVDSGLAYEVVVNYSTDAPEYENPLDEPPEIQWGFADETKAAKEDKDGNAILNAAGDAFEEPLVVPYSRLILSYSVKEPYFDPLVAMEYKDAINETAWTAGQYTFPARTARCTNISGKGPNYAMVGAHPTQVKVEYWDVNYQFEFDIEEWIFKILEQGYRELQGGELVDIFVKDEDGNKTDQRASFPYLLTEDGEAQYDDPKEPVYKEVSIFKEKDFSAFNIVL